VESLIQSVAVWALPVLAAVVLHELAHGWVAYRLGDDTAARAGRLTLNPLAHIDPFGSIAIPLLLIVAGSPFLFGYAKPVPVNFGNLRNFRRDMVRVAAAGPVMNLILAVLSAAAFHVLAAAGKGLAPDAAGSLIVPPLAMMAVRSTAFNIVLAVFNLIPLPPLDGGRVLVGLLPRTPAIAVARLEPYGMMIIFLLLATHTIGRVINPVISLFVRALL
jgi:Zn-dependent protease